ncbi:Thioesterase superfamily protein isoform 1 [Forsythia ovata]|uniref:Thioesterase superfamily protein isoform 1 n=1 Tax=Forsythia ovata TaxID=205694 RepID=A0ABD1RJW6_9LAMI
MLVLLIFRYLECSWLICFLGIIASHFPGAVYVKQTLEFRSPVYCGEEITGELHASNIRQVKEKYMAKFTTKCFKDGGILVIDEEKEGYASAATAAAAAAAAVLAGNSPEEVKLAAVVISLNVRGIFSGGGYSELVAVRATHIIPIPRDIANLLLHNVQNPCRSESSMDQRWLMMVVVFGAGGSVSGEDD